MSEIEEMEDECEEIHSGGLLKRYVERPASLQNVTLADWAAWYDSCGKPYQKKSTELDLDNLPKETLIDDENNDDELCDQSTTDNVKTKSNIKKRTNSRIIRSVWFNQETQPEKHCEFIMLFIPWKNEETDLISHYSSFKEHYLARTDEISEQMSQYAVCSEDLN